MQGNSIILVETRWQLTEDDDSESTLLEKLLEIEMKEGSDDDDELFNGINYNTDSEA